MKKLILTAIAVTCAVSVFAQGTVVFNNRVVGTTVFHVYAPLAGQPGFSQIGNGTADFAVGSTSWAGWTAIGGAGIAGQYGASATLSQLLGGLGASQPEGSLGAALPITTFRTGAVAGFVAGQTTSFGNTSWQDTAGTVAMVAWDNSSGLYPTWAQAYTAWTKGLVAAGRSNPINLTFGGTGTPANLIGMNSFNLYIIPEPSTFALAGLGLASLLVLRRRK
jgi:hypothetical protein